MTYENRYNVRSVVGIPDQLGLTLREASKALQAANQRGQVRDATRVTRSSCGRERFVAFYCCWRDEVWPAFQALPKERDVLLAWTSAITLDQD